MKYTALTILAIRNLFLGFSFCQKKLILLYTSTFAFHSQILNYYGV